ncbi:MAG: hypothetical protein FJY53_00290 [Betaproteobacteria bacterium]|nr:hypothetical protein [Betaproteobacteria bacterium]
MPHIKKQPSMLTWSIIRKGLAYILSGKFRVKNGHLPPSDHAVPPHFMGVCVASAADPQMDDYVIENLKSLKIHAVRLDFTYGDLEGFNARFLNRLLTENFSVTLHLLQPFLHARAMEAMSEQQMWRDFLEQTLEQFGARVARVEIGSTINRKRWAGYTMAGFLHTWDIAFKAVKQRGIQLAGPNVTDFEPIYNIGVLSILKTKKQLPDVHTDNLFSERVSEPERFDHRILKYRCATALKFNLVKKARLLRKVTDDFLIRHFISPVAFWAIYRIKRLLPDGEQKQADYATRYMVLNAASGALDQVFWGALICQREGLINDGLTETDYPALERVTHYASVNGQIQNFKHHASFYAIKTVADIIQGAHYQSALVSTKGLELHHFKTAQHEVHILWTINGKAAYSGEIYPEEALRQAEVIHRDGYLLNHMPDLICETPVYLRWPLGYKVRVKEHLAIDNNLAIHAHINGLKHYHFLQDGWQGVILAKDREEANLLAQSLHPSKLISPQKDRTLRHARNAIWALPDPRDATKQITVKQPVKMYPHKALLDRFKPSKAKRSWNGAAELLRRGIDTAYPVAFFEQANGTSLKQNFYLCDYVQADCSVGEMFVHFANGNKEFYFAQKNRAISAENTYAQLAYFLHRLHASGTFFRDLSGGNILVQLRDDHTLRFSLIDTARAWFFNHATPFEHRIADMTRICNKLHWDGRERLMGLYLANTGKKFCFRTKLSFYLYDLKVNLKRKYGRKGIKKLINKFKK